MKHFVLTVLAVLCLATGAWAALPTDPNTRDAWYQGDFEGVRIHYSYSSKDSGDLAVSSFHCRVDYFHDGGIRLLAVESFVYRVDSPVRTTTFYTLKPTTVRQYRGSELARTSYQFRWGPELVVRPVITEYDPFTKRCVSHLPDLLGKIPAPEAKMFRDQYGDLFGVK